MAGGFTIDTLNREINQENYRENHSPATLRENQLGQKRDAAYVVDTEQNSRKRHSRPKKPIQEKAPLKSSIGRPCEGKANPPPYCTFHKSRSHDTSECRQLHEILLGKYQREEAQNVDPSTSPPRSRLQPEIDRAVRSAHLASCNSGPSQQDNQVSDRHKASTSARFKGPHDRHSIHIILGEPDSDKDKDPVQTMEYHRESKNDARRKQPDRADRIDLARNDLPVIFSEADAASLDLPHNESIVITLAADSHDITKIQIDSCDVTKIEIDSGRKIDFSCP